MKIRTVNNQNPLICFLFVFLILITSCKEPSKKNSLIFRDYQNLKIGFSTQNFQKAMPVDVKSLTEIIEYASKQGYQFIELRDDLAKFTMEECRELADIAIKNKIDVIYEIQKNPLDTGYFKVFERALENTLIFRGPGILRTVISKSEFDADQTKIGWSKDELVKLTILSDSCALIAKAKNVRFIVENFNESFFGDSSSYFGIDDFFDNTTFTGLQLDIGNPFRSSSRGKADPEIVSKYLSGLGNRWVTSHLKTVIKQGGDSQPVLTENPLPIEKVVSMMASQNVLYCALELAPVTDKQQCFINHSKSIQFLKEHGVLKN
jgi:hypothetical protein